MLCPAQTARAAGLEAARVDLGAAVAASAAVAATAMAEVAEVGAQVMVVAEVVEIKEGRHNPAEMAVTVEVLLVELDQKAELVEPINQVQI